MQLLSFKNEKEVKIIKAILKAIQAEHRLEASRSRRAHGGVTGEIGGQSQWEEN